MQDQQDYLLELKTASILTLKQSMAPAHKLKSQESKLRGLLGAIGYAGYAADLASDCRFEMRISIHIQMFCM